MEAEAREKVKKYIDTVKFVLRSLSWEGVSEKAEEILDLCKRYVSDAEYYLEDKGDEFTSLACIAYAEGLLDALRLLGIVKFEWPKLTPRVKRKVLVGGVFDIIHPGHLYLLRRASELGDVIVIVAKDETVKKLKGREPIIPEEQRLEVVKAIRYVKEAVLGREPLSIEWALETFSPDIVLLGPDQAFLEEMVREAIRRGAGSKAVQVIRLKERKHDFPLCSTSQILEKIRRRLRNA